MSSDYRVMNGEVPFENIKEKKKEYYENHLSVEHPRAKNHYRILSKKCEKQRFGNVAYNKKCAYCGVPSYINDINNYEIDHFKNQSHNEDLDCVNKIDNLVYACHDCNRAKSSFDFPKEYEKILDPDSDTVKEVFFCDSDLSTSKGIVCRMRILPRESASTSKRYINGFATP